ncbi:hypothetical protein M2135_000005 [Parabacteroides sp. PF5-9]|nr:hypothetical protein [Parabacteroides sp. PF5-9]
MRPFFKEKEIADICFVFDGLSGTDVKKPDYKW